MRRDYQFRKLKNYNYIKKADHLTGLFNYPTMDKYSNYLFHNIFIDLLGCIAS